jgi:hypothetical protein
MPDTDNTHRTELPKITDNGINNNFGEWEIKSYHKLREWDMLKYVEGPESLPPIVPTLRHTTCHRGVNDDGLLCTIHIPGNEEEHEDALAHALPWMTGNNSALARIVAAVPSHQLHLVKRVIYAKQAWESLRSVYQPRNSLRGATIKSQIMSYRCQSDMNIAIWLNDMQCLYNSLCDLDPECMSDRDFALAILDLLPQDDGWRDFVSNLRTKVRDSDTKSLPIDSIDFITPIREEYWYRHKDDDQTSSHIFSARSDAQKRANSQKRPRPADVSTASTDSPNKRTRVQNTDKPARQCTNSFCGAPRGHNTSECISYKGAKAGQYGPWWHGPWNIHLPPSQRSPDNNIPPKSHPDYSRKKPTVSQSHATDNSVDRSTTTHIQATDECEEAKCAITSASDTTCYAWHTQSNDEAVFATLPVLNHSLPRDNSCYHDSGANRHVFHNRSVFEQYESIQPLTVKGFGENLSTVAIGRGAIRLEGKYGHQTCPILLQNVLHIPAARSNLISGVQLDKAGVVSTLGHNNITLSMNNKNLVGGAIINDMYRLDLRVLPPTSLSLALSSTAPSLLSRIEPSVSHSLVPSAFYTA